jgi:hypothetical protein
LGFESWQEQVIFLFFKASRAILVVVVTAAGAGVAAVVAHQRAFHCSLFFNVLVIHVV